MTLLTSLPTISVAILAICCTFVIFRLQWLRREIDDYRGRITFFDFKNEEYYFKMSDKKFKKKGLQNIKKIIKRAETENISQSGITTIQLKEINKQWTLNGSILLFEKRYEQKCFVIDFFVISWLVFSLSFFSTYYSIAVMCIFIWLYILLKNDY